MSCLEVLPYNLHAPSRYARIAKLSPEGLLLISGIAFQSFIRAFSNLDANSTSEFQEARIDFRQGTVLDCYGNAFLIYTYRIVVHPFLLQNLF